MSKEVKKCAHDTCNCMARDNDKYCSQFCKDSKGVTSLKCDCGHPACSSGKF